MDKILLALLFILFASNSFGAEVDSLTGRDRLSDASQQLNSMMNDSLNYAGRDEAINCNEHHNEKMAEEVAVAFAA